jgi:cytochrome c
VETRKYWTHTLLGASVLTVSVSCAEPEAVKAQEPTSPGGTTAPGVTVAKPSLLVFSRTQAYRHAAIAAGIEALSQLALDHGWSFTATEDAEAFTDAKLGAVNVVVFLNTTGDVLDNEQQSAMERFIQAGNGFVGIHAATDTEYEWPWYGTLVGARFKVHPAVQQATVQVEDKTHLATKHLPASWVHTDEWYAFDANPRPQVQVLLTVDESSYQAEASAMGDHPIAWCHAYDGGRAFYTALGHTVESYQDAKVVQHLAGGILWASGN